MENQQAQGKTQPRGNKPQWTIVKAFADTETGLIVQITALALYRGTEYNWELQQVRQGSPLPSRHIRPRLGAGSNPAVAVFCKDGMTAARLIDEALLWIESAKQFDLDRQIETKQEYELRAIERETRGPQKKAGLSQFVDGVGKTAREAGKHQRHEANLAARRAADQERTRTTKGKGG